MIKRMAGVFAIISIIIVISIYITMGKLSSVLAYSNNLNEKKDDTINPVKVAVLLNITEDPYTENVRKALTKIQNENPNMVKFEFYYSNNDQDTQNRLIEKVIDEGIDLIAIKMADAREAIVIANKIKENNKPVVFFSREPISLVPIKSYSKSIFIGTRGADAGVLQGKIIIDQWNENSYIIDKNRDGILQYIMITGQSYNLEAIERTKYSIETINKAGIKTEELASVVSDFKEDLAKEAVNALFLKFGDKIEAVIANNDAMAIGAIKALQQFGYNKGDKNKTIVVVGIDAIDEAKDFIAKGFMTGTVIQDADEMAKAIYLTGMNLINKRPPLEGTPYVFDETGVAVRIPYKEYIK